MKSLFEDFVFTLGYVVPGGIVLASALLAWKLHFPPQSLGIDWAMSEAWQAALFLTAAYLVGKCTGSWFFFLTERVFLFLHPLYKLQALRYIRESLSPGNANVLAQLEAKYGDFTTIPDAANKVAIERVIAGWSSSGTVLQRFTRMLTFGERRQFKKLSQTTVEDVHDQYEQCWHVCNYCKFSLVGMSDAYWRMLRYTEGQIIVTIRSWIPFSALTIILLTSNVHMYVKGLAVLFWMSWTRATFSVVHNRRGEQREILWAYALATEQISDQQPKGLH